MSSTPPIRTVMLIDDETFDQKLYQRVIARSGLVGEVLPFLYADEALAFLSGPVTKPVDVILLDINMPRMDGFEFLEAAMRDLGPAFARIVVVMLTTSLEPSDRKRAAACPLVRRFINKPLSIEHLAEIAEMLQDLPE